MKTTNVPGITGDGIVMAEKAGANLIDMGLIQLLPSTDPATGATTHKLGNSTCMFVNKDGKRFVNELERRDVLSKAALAQPDHIFFVITCDETNWADNEGRNSYGIKVADLLRQKKVFRGDTIEELAKNAGINAENLKKSIEYWQTFCKDPKSDPFGRASCERGTELPKGPGGPRRWGRPFTTRWAACRSTRRPRCSTRTATSSPDSMPPVKSRAACTARTAWARTPFRTA